MAGNRWLRLAPLTGLAFVVLVILAFFVISHGTPDTGDPAGKVVTYYKAHSDREFFASILGALGVAFLLFFASQLRSALRVAQPVSDRLPNTAFAGTIAAAAGFLVAAAIHLALADAAKKAHVSPQALQALNVLDNDDFLPLVAGLAVMVFASGLAIVRGIAVLPRWLGWFAIVLGVLTFTPAGFFAFVLDGLWVAIVSVMLYLRWDRVQAADAERGGPAAPAPAAGPAG